MVRRTELEDVDNFLERQCFNLNPEGWVQFYKDRVLGNLDTNDGGLPLTEDDLDELDRYMAQQESAWRDSAASERNISNTVNGKHTMTGAKSPLVWGDIEQTGNSWGPWK